MQYRRISADCHLDPIWLPPELSVSEAPRLRIYNTWLHQFCSHHPDRSIGLACLPYGDIEAAVAEVRRVAKLGFKGVERSCSWGMEPMWHPCWEPLWAAVDEVGIPLHFQTFPAVPPKIREQFAHLPAPVTRTLTCENAGRSHGLIH
jgi:predicted TIM-barrel fold metal-dependent hydrolase